MELTLQKLKRQANLIANEYSAVESQAAERFHTGRSESRSWNSEYDEKYPDYTKSRGVVRNDLYRSKSPFAINKSPLSMNQPQLRRGPKSAMKKIYYMQ